ncbi:MAG TPA: hypothetical protein VN282_05235 [Pyrinomonadaceae bacterium]|nr:hypothetical protein [Pyrinomonadaceae bacterium]
MFLFVLSVGAGVGAAPVRQVHWQWSEAPSVRLGVRDKNDDLKGFEANFVVTAARTGRQWRKTVKVEGDNFGYVNFPDEFAAFDWATHATRFDWTCAVGGKVVVKGKFVMATTDELDSEAQRATKRGRR